MTRESATTGLVTAALLLAGVAAWVLALRPDPRVDTTPLLALPSHLGLWQSEDIPLESAVESILQADFNLQRRYRHPLGDVVWVYFGYYGTARGGRPEHTPAVCFRAHGWTIEDHRVIEAGGGLRVNEMVVSLGDERQLVHYWYRSFRRTGLRGGVDQLFDHLVGRLFYDRADGSLVRLSTRFGDESDRPVARSRLLQFATSFDEQLAAYWPRELPAGSDRVLGLEGQGGPARAGGGDLPRLALDDLAGHRLRLP